MNNSQTMRFRGVVHGEGEGTFWHSLPGYAARNNFHVLLKEYNILEDQIFEVPSCPELGQFTLGNSVAVLRPAGPF